MCVQINNWPLLLNSTFQVGDQVTAVAKRYVQDNKGD